MVETGGKFGLDPLAAELLVCPRDLKNLRAAATRLRCPDGHDYPILGGVPVMLLRDQLQTQVEGERSISAAMRGEEPAEPPQSPNSIDAFVRRKISTHKASTKLDEYPIPRVDFSAASSKDCFLDLGCGWGRWCIAAARAGYRVVGIDADLEAIMAARRVARQLGAAAAYIVADARWPPFAPESFDVVHSYGLLEHFLRRDAERAVIQAARVAKPAGLVTIQWTNALGLRSIYRQARRGFRRSRGFEVRYWTPFELRDLFEREVGAPHLAADAFFAAENESRNGAGRRNCPAMRLSALLREASERFPPLAYLADSVTVSALKR
ncbi:MAG TPA: methyltransferase domain-containing protein [Candidatus Binataceae bacterium]|nr:methyltransferase domain-containing protein [Candidatus Binataceae bacterium]